MRKRSVRRAVGGAVACVLTGGVVAVAVITFSGHSGTRSGEHGVAGNEAFAPALARHIEKLKEALPGNQGESAEGPGAADAAALAALAYPAADIPLARLEREKQTFNKVEGRGFQRNGTWVSVGPSAPVYPFFGPRDLGQYVPNEYVAASRIDAMVIDPNCRPGNCRAWIGPAGGGIWRTKDALADTPS